jgi:hypothetical protein
MSAVRSSRKDRNVFTIVRGREADAELARRADRGRWFHHISSASAAVMRSN